MGEKLFVTINLDGGTITPLINDDFWSNLPRILKNGGFVVDRRSINLLTKSIRKASEICFLVKTPKIGGFVVDCNSIDLYNKIGGFVVDRKSIDLLTKSIRNASEMRLA